MWLPLQVALEYLGCAAAWLAVMAAFGAAAALLVTSAARRPWRSAWPALVVAGILGALLGASLADRFGLPDVVVFRMWCREVSLAWSVGGALGGAMLAWAWGRFRPRRGAAAPAVTVPPETPGEG